MAELTEWARRLLEGRHYGVLGTEDPNGMLHLTPVWYLFRDGQLFVGMPSSSRKARNAAERPRASLLVDVRTPGTECWVSGAGSTTFLRGSDAQSIVRAIQERYLTPEALAHPGIGPEFAAADDVALCIRPSTWRSWRAADLDAQFFGGALGASPNRWFHALE